MKDLFKNRMVAEAALEGLLLQKLRIEAAIEEFRQLIARMSPSEANVQTTPKRRGRPPGSKNRAKPGNALAQASVKVKKNGGKPSAKKAATKKQK